jgi:hypothetical protein
MNKIITTALMTVALGTSALYADMANMAKDAAMTKAKTTAKAAVIEQAAGSSDVTKEIVKKAADKVSPEASAEDKVKSAVTEKLLTK